MTPIDLIDYTNTNEKIPAKLLRHRPIEETTIPTYKILASYLLDCMVIFEMTFLMAIFMQLSLGLFMITDELFLQFSQIKFERFLINMLPLIFLTYYFFSYFFNQGQTWGMKVLKSRIHLEFMSFRASLRWAIFSFSVIMTAGLTFPLIYSWMQRKNQGKIKSHDHLYQDLMLERVLSPIDLIKLTQLEELNQTPYLEKEKYPVAA